LMLIIEENYSFQDKTQHDNFTTKRRNKHAFS